MRGTIYIEKEPGDDGRVRMLRMVLEHRDCSTEAEFRERVERQQLEPGEAISFGPIGKPWGKV